MSLLHLTARSIGMRLLPQLINGLFLATVATVGLFAGRTHVQPLVRDAFGTEVQELEDAAARRTDRDSVRALASAYLDRNEPGLARAALDRAPPDAIEDPSFAYVEARALYSSGRAGEALSVLRGALAGCEGTARPRCPAWLVAKTSRQAAFLDALVSVGVEDAAAHPEAARLALERTRREGRVVAIAMR
jgi:hypothetical protein